MISDSGVILSLHRATHHTLRALGAALADLGLTSAEINALANLADRRSRSVKQLGVDTGTPPTTLTGVLDRLQGRGYLTRELDPADRRSFRLTLTGAGQAAAARVRHEVAALEESALRGLTAGQVASYHAVITALQEACDEH